MARRSTNKSDYFALGETQPVILFFFPTDN